MKKLIKRIPFLGELGRSLYRRLRGKPKQPPPFPGSAKYWKQRYEQGGSSGVGSYGKYAEFKAEIINDFVNRHSINSIIEYGCGDGNQLKLSDYPNYLGFDVSETAVDLCKKIFEADKHKSFKLLDDYGGEKADLTLSLDVIYHLIEDEVFERHVRRLFGSSHRYVIIYSSNTDNNKGYEGTYIKHRKFTDWVEVNLRGWKLIAQIPNRYPYKGDDREGSFADFYIYQKV